MTTVAISVITNIVLLTILVISIYFNFKLGKNILEIQDGIEESLDILDGRYKSMSEVLEKPVFFDSTEIRQVISDINKSRDAVLYVANILGEVEDIEENTGKKV